MLEEDEFGLLELPEPAPAPTPEDRLVAAYEEIAEFTREHGRPPEKDPANIDEFKLANTTRSHMRRRRAASCARAV